MNGVVVDIDMLEAELAPTECSAQDRGFGPRGQGQVSGEVSGVPRGGGSMPNLPRRMCLA